MHGPIPGKMQSCPPAPLPGSSRQQRVRGPEGHTECQCNDSGVDRPRAVDGHLWRNGDTLNPLANSTTLSPSSQGTVASLWCTTTVLRDILLNIFSHGQVTDQQGMKTQVDTMPEQQLSPQHMHSGRKGARAAASATRGRDAKCSKDPKAVSNREPLESKRSSNYVTCLIEPS